MGITLLLTSKLDPTSDYLQEVFNLKNKRISRVNIDNSSIPKISLDPLGNTGWIEDINKEKINIKDITAIIFRRPQTPKVHNNIIKNRFLTRELLQGLKSLLESTNAIWMNRPSSTEAASSKPGNLSLAAELGLTIPETLISSDIKEINDWLKKHENCVMKSISHGLMRNGKNAKMAFTQRIPKNFNVKKEIMPKIPVMLQTEISKLYDLRVTVVGDEVFSACLEANYEKVDWRASENNSKWFRYNLPNKISNACIKLCSKLKLHFAAIDFIITPEKKFFFLEINPNGQWVWIEKETGLKISEAIVNYLTRKSNG